MKILLPVLTFAVLFATGLAALASDGTVNRSWQEDFYVFDGSGNGRTNCASSRFTTRTYRGGALSNQTWTFRNFTSNGMYEATTTPLYASRYVTFVFYSSAYVGTFTKWVRAYDLDTAYAGLDGHMSAQDSAISAVDDDPWDNPGRFLSNYTGIDARLTAAHGSGLWSAAGSVTVVPFQGSVSFESVTKARDVHVVRGDSVAIPYSVGRDLTGWTVWFGAKANPSDAEYAVPLRDVTAYVTDASSGSGLINLTSSDTGIPARRYLAEVEVRKPGEVNTPLRFSLWVDADVIR